MLFYVIQSEDAQQEQLSTLSKRDAAGIRRRRHMSLVEESARWSDYVAGGFLEKGAGSELTDM